MSYEVNMEGGCLCGSIRYRISENPFASEYCHCRICQKSSGSPAVPWMDFKVEQITWLKTKPNEYSSSENVRRGFCSECGSTISFRDIRYPQYLTLTVVSLDNPNMVKPTYHIYTESQLEWFNTDDNHKKFLRGQISE